jgi:hypothetical protein
VKNLILEFKVCPRCGSELDVTPLTSGLKCFYCPRCKWHYDQRKYSAPGDFDVNELHPKPWWYVEVPVIKWIKKLKGENHEKD